MTSSFDHVFFAQYDNLVARAGRMLPHGLGDAEDYVHLAYLRCRASWSSEQCSSRNQGAYFLRSIRWLVLDALRRRRREAALMEQAAAIRPQTAATDFSPAVALEAFKAMSRRQRELGEALLAGKTAAEIEQQLGISKAAYAVGLSRLRKAWMKRSGE